MSFPKPHLNVAPLCQSSASITGKHIIGAKPCSSYYEAAFAEGRLRVEGALDPNGGLRPGQCARHFVHRHEPPVPAGEPPLAPLAAKTARTPAGTSVTLPSLSCTPHARRIASECNGPVAWVSARRFICRRHGLQHRTTGLRLSAAPYANLAWRFRRLNHTVGCIVSPWPRSPHASWRQNDSQRTAPICHPTRAVGRGGARAPTPTARRRRCCMPFFDRAQCVSQRRWRCSRSTAASWP